MEMLSLNLVDIKRLKHKVDFGIITIREDEFEAVLQRFPLAATTEGRRRYGLSNLQTYDGAEYVIALARCHEQGTGEGQNIASDLIEDFDPQWLLLVGIAGGGSCRRIYIRRRSSCHAAA